MNRVGWYDDYEEREFQNWKDKVDKFSELIDQLHPNYRGQAWGIAHRDGLDDAIAFCETKILDSNLMQACRDSENAINN